MIHVDDLRSLIVRPTLERLGLWSPVAEELLLGTAAVESELGLRLGQVHGPALGIYQIELTTAQEIAGRRSEQLAAFEIPHMPLAMNVTGNLYFATAMCRLIYYRVTEPLPEFTDPLLLGSYWKTHYNTSLGKGKVSDYIHKYLQFVGRPTD